MSVLYSIYDLKYQNTLGLGYNPSFSPEATGELTPLYSNYRMRHYHQGAQYFKGQGRAG